MKKKIMNIFDFKNILLKCIKYNIVRARLTNAHWTNGLNRTDNFTTLILRLSGSID